MKADELSGYIGEIDDELIINAKKSRPKYKNILLVIGSMAACITIAGAGIFVFMNRKPEIYNGYAEKGTDISSVITGGAVSEKPHTEESVETAPEHITSDIYFIRDGKTEFKSIEHKATPQDLFYLWKNMNFIGDDVQFISVKIESDASVTESEVDGQGVATYHIGSHYVYNLTITKDIENYYSVCDRNLLLETLKKTMLDTVEMRIDDYNLILTEG